MHPVSRIKIKHLFRDTGSTGTQALFLCFLLIFQGQGVGKGLCLYNDFIHDGENLSFRARLNT